MVLIILSLLPRTKPEWSSIRTEQYNAGTVSRKKTTEVSLSPQIENTKLSNRMVEIEHRKWD
jgi:hypothetical protein